MKIETLARKLAMDIHKHDKHGGDPYIFHLERVVKNLRKRWGGDALPTTVAIAWLHDTYEDHPERYLETVRPEMPAIVDYAVRQLARGKDEDYAEYILRVKGEAHPATIAVKIADLEDHLSRPGAEEQKQRYAKYKLAHHILTLELKRLVY